MTLQNYIIYNPAAGKGTALKKLPLVESYLKKAGFQYELVLTQRPGQALELARQAAADGRRMVIAAGGDGTVNEVINGIMYASANGADADSRPILGVLPVGSGNDFAFGVNIPKDLKTACLAVADGSIIRIDIGHVAGGDYPQGRYFGNGIGLGFDTVVGFEAAKMKRVKGAFSYLVAVFKTIFLYAKAPVYQVEIDGTTTTQAYLMISIMNGRRMGGSFMMAPDGDPCDGAFNLCLVDQVSQPMIIRLVPTFISGTQGRHSQVRMMTARRIHIRAVEGSIPAHADGETLCTAGQELLVKLCPASLNILSSERIEQK